MDKFVVSTPTEGFVDITAQIAAIVRAAGIGEGICHIFVPHTTAGVTINENADPDVVADMLAGLDKIVPRLPYRHAEGNSPAHIKASLLGAAATVPITGGSLMLGTWQAVYLGEFDGPRRRTVCVTLVGR
ncbi:secondary thiamine-phosphate synthase enzyme YjbQ [Anaeroselena agilis]|uniref:Secondary thiamine-phosphate synthase enzyme YjbQ n=1 Tax=Anaeroselena agilis TaxID=3063788 RepID=A0ABU3NUQ9_9FIRM|nr:secondary thiamine-phosphate synthase enzyme YjbQ [Selenomonadales bacterium 4137-cl]